jgi:hypothetical protein
MGAIVSPLRQAELKEVSKTFFFEKKKQKTFARWPRGFRPAGSS